MLPFTTLTATAAPLPLINVDTDMIIPAQFLKTIKRTGLGQFLFARLRTNADGSEKPDFVLNKPAYRQAHILIAGENFGCGSSREHAPWALLDFGIRCVIAPSFADIFFNNCFKNGILPIALPGDTINALLSYAERSDNKLTVDLEKQQITLSGSNQAPIHFDVEPFRKRCLLGGLDDIGLTLEKAARIDAFETKQRTQTPWLYS